MSSLSIKCPYCQTEPAYFSSVCEFHQVDTENFTVFFKAHCCQKGVTALVYCVTTPSPHEFTGNLGDSDHHNVIMVLPQPQEVATPEHLPDNIKSIFLQAKDNIDRGQNDAAVPLCRRILDIATRTLGGDKSKTLYERIEELAGKQTITPLLKDWAHTIRLDGNEGTHSDDLVEDADAEELFSFTELFLLYAYTMPKMLELKRKTKEKNKSKD